MLSVLVITGLKLERVEVASALPSLEVLHAQGMEEALEKLGRNRRIDAVLLFAGSENKAIAEAIREDNPAPPPLFAPTLETPEGCQPLAGSSLSQFLEALVGRLS